MRKMIVVAAVIRKEGKILLAERRSDSSIPGWEFPGGKVESGESPEQALSREISEELGVQCRIIRPLETVSLPDKPDSKLIAFEVELLDDQFHLISHRQIFWVEPEELTEYNLLPADRELVRKFIDKKLFEPSTQIVK
ncbi:MAG: (deoxy)nucleoside triphosphate pyrophosphohydrolase [Candidatus Aminicenantes bacterium]|nr:(deoxy)nucleoside triphosphate pyrophosphohydrolase [Candidatus Aminicenantes bacterium]